MPILHMLHTLRWLGYGMYGIAALLVVLGLVLIEGNTCRPYYQGPPPLTETFAMAALCTAVALTLTVLP